MFHADQRQDLRTYTQVNNRAILETTNGKRKTQTMSINNPLQSTEYPSHHMTKASCAKCSSCTLYCLLLTETRKASSNDIEEVWPK
jgi:hypothetical protein